MNLILQAIPLLCPLIPMVESTALHKLTDFKPMNTAKTPSPLRHMLSSSLKQILFLCATSLIACSNVGSMDFPGVYKIGIAQGNIITQEMVDQLRPGMTKRQVIFVMGTPLVRDPYHQDRWDYIYNFQPGGGVRGQERVSVFFMDDELVSFTGDFVPTDSSVPTEEISDS